MAPIAWDQDLTPSQRGAAGHDGTHARLLAGPGTGKTSTLIARIARLITERGADPSQIIVLTFTRAAAAELRRRVAERLGEGAHAPRISTLHSFALRQLLRNAAHADLPQPLRIEDDYEQRWIVVEEITALTGKRVRDVRRLFHELSSDWQRLTPEWRERFPDPAFLGAWLEHREVYGYTLRSELVYQLKLAMDEHELDLEGPPRFALIDEYQDLNACDLAVIRALVSRGCEVFVAGDDDQSIYGFRFANPDGIRRFPDEYDPCTLLELDLCQRCGRHILDYALHVARQDVRRIEKPLRTRDDMPPGTVHVLRFRNQYFEARGISRLCTWLVGQEGVPPGEILILLRNDRYRWFSDPIRDTVQGAGVPVAIVSDPLAPLNDGAGRALLSLMRLALNLEDHLAWRALLAVRDNRLGDQGFAQLYDLARRTGQRYAAVLQAVKADPQAIPRLGVRIAEEIAAVEQTIEEIGTPEDGKLDEWLEAVAGRVVGEETLRNDILALFRRVRRTIDADSLEGLLRALTVSVGDAEQERQEGAVSIMTMHQAKGLSARAVIVAAAEDEYIPGRAQGEEVDDERRLLYVSLTRARTHLFVTACQQRIDRQTRTGRTAEQARPGRTLSRFLRGGPVALTDGEAFIGRLAGC